jgi:hypothetical protein
VALNPLSRQSAVGHHEKYESDAAVLFVTAQLPP